MLTYVSSIHVQNCLCSGSGRECRPFLQNKFVSSEISDVNNDASWIAQSVLCIAQTCLWSEEIVFTKVQIWDEKSIAMSCYLLK